MAYVATEAVRTAFADSVEAIDGGELALASAAIDSILGSNFFLQTLASEQGWGVPEFIRFSDHLRGISTLLENEQGALAKIMFVQISGGLKGEIS